MISLLLALLIGTAWADSITINKFGGLNNATDSTVINDNQFQDALNVELNKAGTGVRKRDGYSSFLTVSGVAGSVDSVFDFKNSNGDECMIISSSGTVYRSINQTTAVSVTTITATARLYCSSSQGLGYCFASDASGDPFTYDCVTFTYRTANSYPDGKANAFSNDRQYVVGVAASPNTIFASQQGAYTTFTTGLLDTSGFTEDVATAGDKLTAIEYLNGRVIAFKEYSIIGYNIVDQFNVTGYSISDNVGVANPEAVVINEGRAYFKGSDNRFYVIDGSPGGIDIISLPISTTTASLLSGKTRYSIQTSKADFDAGNLSFAGAQSPMRSDIVVGSVLPSSVTFVDTSSANWVAGSFDSRLSTRVLNGTLQISTAPFLVYNGGFETGTTTYWTCDASASATCLVTSGSPLVGTYSAVVTVGCSGVGSANVLLLDANNNTLATQSSGQTGGTIDLTAYSTQTLKIRFSAGSGGNSSTLTSTTFTAISSVSWMATSGGDCPAGGNFGFAKIDEVRMNRYFDINQSSDTRLFTSQTFNTAFSTPIGGPFTASSTTPAGTSLLYAVQSASSSSGVWTDWTSITNGNKINEVKQYYRYLSTFTTSVGTQTPVLKDVTLIAATSGQFVTQCIQPNPITAWGALEAVTLSSGTGSMSFAVSTGASCALAGGVWTAQSTGTTISVATASAVKIRTTFAIGSATDTARLYSITANWAEANVAPPSYSTYWDNGLYWSVADAGTTNNKMLKYDLLFGEWFLFDIPFNALHTFNNQMYGGCTTCGKVYKYSNIVRNQAPTSDDGANINAYFKTKDFSASPFIENNYETISLVATNQNAGTITNTWKINGGQLSGNYSVSTSTGDNVVRSNYRFPAGKNGTFFNLNIGNNSTTPFEILGIRVDFSPLDWRVLP